MKLSSKGAMNTFGLGYHLDRIGRLSAIPFNKSPLGQQIIQLVQPITHIITTLLKQLDNEFYTLLKTTIPSKYRLFGMLTAFFCNLTSPSNTHRDLRDAKWCFIFNFGNMTTTKLELPYCNAALLYSIGDLIMLKSKDVWHSGDKNVPPNVFRGSGVFTTHTGVINKFI